MFEMTGGHRCPRFRLHFHSAMFRWLLLGLFFFAEIGCTQNQGRVAVILDNSGSMSTVGTEFFKIKETLVDQLTLLPSQYEVGLRVFDDNGSQLAVPYRRKPIRSELERGLRAIKPGGGTYIGQSLLAAVDDLTKFSGNDGRLILITDGEGSSDDVADAERAWNRLENSSQSFKCSIILYSTRVDPLNETPIGRISKVLGCDLVLAGKEASAVTLTPALQRILSLDFYWIWIVVSVLLYFMLLSFTAYLIFSTQYARGMLPRYARLYALVTMFLLLPIIIGTHAVGLFPGLSRYMGLFVLLAVVTIALATLGVGRARVRSCSKGFDDDPFV